MKSSKMIHPFLGEIPCFTKQDIKENIGNLNKKKQFSKQFEVFKPIKIELLKSLSEITGDDYSDYPEENLEIGTIATLEMNPGGSLYLINSGMCCLTNAEILKEGIDFKFV